MYRQGLSAAVAFDGSSLPRMSLLLLLLIGACSDEMPSSPISDDAPASDARPVQWLTGARTSLPFDVWICGDEVGQQRAYVFNSDNPESPVDGTGVEVELVEQQGLAFRWSVPEPGELQLRYIDSGDWVRWKASAVIKGSGVSVVDSRRGAQRCLRESVSGRDVERALAAGRRPVSEGIESDDDSNTRLPEDSGGGKGAVPDDALTSLSAEQALAILVGDSPGNLASALLPDGSGDVSIWVCDSANGPLAQTYLQPESERIQGRVLDARGINAVHSGRWMLLADDVLRLDLAEQGEVILDTVTFDGSERFTANSGRDGSIDCRREILAFPASSAAS